jgi:hypothetical protein
MAKPTDTQGLTCSEFTVNGPRPSQFEQKLILTSFAVSWKNGPNVVPHFPQSNFTYFNWGNTPLRRVTTPETRTRQFKLVCLKSLRVRLVGNSVILTWISEWIRS